MASGAANRLLALNRSKILCPLARTRNGSVSVATHSRLGPNGKRLVPAIHPVDARLCANLVAAREVSTAARYHASTAPAHAEEIQTARESSPSSDSNRTKWTYLDKIRSGHSLNWLPAHWVTTIYGDLFAGKKPVSPDDALLLLGCFDARLAEETPENRVKMAEKAWQDVKASGATLDIRHYNALIKVYLENNHKFDPEDFLMILSEDGVAMDREAYQLFVAGYCQAGNMTDAMRTLEFMKSKEMKMDRHLFHSLIRGHVLIGDLTGAENLTKMMNRVYEVRAEDFVAVGELHAAMGNVDKVLETFIDLNSQSLTPTSGEVFRVLAAYLDWCVGNNKYPEDSALDSLYDTLKGASLMPGHQSVVCQNVVKLQTSGFHDIAAQILTLFPGSKLATQQFFRCAVRTLPFADVLRHCDAIAQSTGGSGDGAIDPIADFCLPEMEQLPFPQLQRVLIDAKESDFSVETITDFLLKKFPAPVVDEVEFSMYRAVRVRTDASLEQMCILSMQLEMSFIANSNFWTTRVFPLAHNFDSFYERLGKAGSKHDERMIENRKPTMMNGFLHFVLTSSRLDRIDVAASILRAHPELKMDLPSDRELVNSISRRFRVREKLSNNLISDAVYVLKRCGQLTGAKVGYLLKGLAMADKNANVPKAIATLMDLADKENALPTLKYVSEALELASTEETRDVLVGLIDDYRKDFLETVVASRLTLDELLDHDKERKGISPISFVVCEKACAQGKEDVALKALAHVRPEFKSASLVQVVNMYVNELGDAFKGLEYLDVLLSRSGLSDEVSIPASTFLRLVEILLRNGRSLADLHLVDELATSRIKLASPFGDFDRTIFKDHLDFISRLDEDKTVIDAYINHLTASNLGPSLVGFQVASVLKKEGVKEALELAKSFFNSDQSAKKTIIPSEEALLEAIVESEDVALLKDFLDMSYVVHGERNAFLNLAFALYRGGKYAQGRRILNVPGLRSDHDKVEAFCERLLREKRHEALEEFCGDVCCIFGVDKADLSFFTLRSLIAKGDKLKALEYYNGLLGSDAPTNERLKQQAAWLFESLNVEYFDKGVTARDYNVGQETADSGPLVEDNVSEVLRNIGNGTPYPIDVYRRLINNALAVNPSSVYVALIEGNGTNILEQLDVEYPAARPYLAQYLVRQNRLTDLLDLCRKADNPGEYLSLLNFQLIRVKPNRGEWISQLELLAEEKPSPEIFARLVNYHLSNSDVEKAESLLRQRPEIDSVDLKFVNSFAVLQKVAEMESLSKSKGMVYYRMILNAALMNIPFLVRRSVDQMLESGVEFYASQHLVNRVKKVIGTNPFVKHGKSDDVAEAKSDSSTDIPEFEEDNLEIFDED